MKQHRVTAEMFNPTGNDSTVPDAYVDPETLKQHGVFTTATPACAVAVLPALPNYGKYQKENNIKPGTEAWFKLWGQGITK